MIFKAIVDWYDDLDNEEKKRGLFIMADSYSNAIEKITQYYGEEVLLKIKVSPWAREDFINFYLDNPDEERLFNKVDKDIGERVFW